MPGRRRWLCLALVGFIVPLLGASVAAAAEFVEYPQFRYVSGLPGNGWAVNALGHAGWEGAMSQAIPLGYTPSSSSFAAAYHSGSINGGIEIGFSGGDVNGMLAGSIGFGSEGHGVCLTLDAVDDEWDLAVNVQGQILEETDSRPAVSVGVLDLFDQREAILGVWPEGPKAQSWYIAATKRVKGGSHPLHATLGFGTDRFNDRPFGGVCYDAHHRVKVLAEYDGFSVNAAAAVQLLPDKKPRGIYKDEKSPRKDALILFLGAADLDHPVVGISYANRALF